VTYDEAKREAQESAGRLGYDYGVAKNAFGYSAFMLPQMRNRYGHELRCEVVSCTDLAKCQPGHGPTATREPARTYGNGWQG
jgi:hypothetical protein